MSPTRDRGMISTAPVWMTPELAKALLDRSAGNRKPSLAKVAQIARDIKSGGWEMTHESVALDGDLHTGRLIDGHHRLEAVVLADTPVPMLVALNAPASSKIDQGVSRKASQEAIMSGQLNVPSRVATLMYSVARTMLKVYGLRTSSKAEQDKVLELYGDLLTSLASWCYSNHNNSFIQRNALYATALTLHLAHGEGDEKSLEQIRTGANLPADDGILAFRAYVVSDLYRSDEETTRLGKMVKCLQAHDEGRPIRTLRVKKPFDVIKKWSGPAEEWRNRVGVTASAPVRPLLYGKNYGTSQKRRNALNNATEEIE